MILDLLKKKSGQTGDCAETGALPAVLVGIVPQGEAEAAESELSLAELRRLADTAGAYPAAVVTQQRDTPDIRTCVGSGKLEEIRDLCRTLGAELVIFDCELSPSQIRNIEDSLDDVRVIDRPMLILDIFALHAESAEGKLQVELAQLKYTAPRLAGKGKDLSRLGGGIGTRGPGESKLESDRRRIRRRITSLEEELRGLESRRGTMRTARNRSGITHFAVVGYTNAGKSSLMNRLTDAGIPAEDKLFKTLDPTTRRFTLPGGSKVLLTDTVGFIRNLPHHLIAAFSSTLEEAVQADMLLIVVDASDPEHESQLAVTEGLLDELGAGDRPSVTVYNKCDRLQAHEYPVTSDEGGDRRSVCVSALTGEGIDRLLEIMENLINGRRRRIRCRIPNSKAGLLNTLYSGASVEDVKYGDEYTEVTACCDSRVAGLLAEYAVRD